MITPKMLAQTLGTWYIDARLYNSTGVPGVMLSITTHQTKCLYWDTDREIWTSAGCQVSVYHRVYIQDGTNFTELSDEVPCCKCSVHIPSYPGGREKHS